MTEPLDHTPDIDFVLSHFKGVRKSTSGWTACCPAHQDRHPSLTIDIGRNKCIVLKCHTGCTFESIVQAANLSISDLFPASAFDPSELPHKGLTLLDLANEKLIPWQLLVNMGITDDPKGGVRIPYYLEDGTLAPRYRIRTALKAKEGSRWNNASGAIIPYGLEDLEEARTAGFLVLVEGESDRWTLKLHHIPVLGIPGAEMTRTLKPEYLTGIERLYLFQEPDNAGVKFVADIQKLLQQWHWTGTAYIVSLPDAKDPNEMHKRGMKGFKESFRQAMDRAEQDLPTTSGMSSPQPSSLALPPPSGLVTLQALLEKPLLATRWTVTDLLPEGLSLLAGKPKQGKSWFALQLAFDVATGLKVLSTYPTTQGDVLYLALEDTESRIQERAKRLLTSMSMPVTPAGITFATTWPRLDQGGMAQLEVYLHTHPHYHLLVIDTWAKLAPFTTGTSHNQYMDDYASLTQLKHLAEQFHLSILVIHHLRKTSATDVLDEITGSTSLVGVADTILVLKRERGQQEATLFVTGRDIVERSSSLTFDSVKTQWVFTPSDETQEHEVASEPPSSAQPSPHPDQASASPRPSSSSVPGKRCPRHPAATRVLFDPSGQAWCERTACWDCYRLMKIGEVLEYPALTTGDRESTIGQGKEAWATFVRTHGTFAVGTATRTVLATCRQRGMDEPDLSHDLQHLVTIPPLAHQTPSRPTLLPEKKDGKGGSHDHTA